jgi:hypothetical protein
MQNEMISWTIRRADGLFLEVTSKVISRELFQFDAEIVSKPKLSSYLFRESKSESFSFTDTPSQNRTERRAEINNTALSKKLWQRDGQVSSGRDDFVCVPRNRSELSKMPATTLYRPAIGNVMALSH